MLANLSLEQSLMKANSHAKKGRVAEAKIIYKEILKTFSKNQRAQQGLAALNKFEQNNVTQSIPQTAINQLVNLFNQGQFPTLIKHAKDLAEQYPDAFIVWSLMGASFVQIGNLERAIQSYQEALSIKPDYVDGYNNIGVALQNKGELDEAIEAFQKALILKPNDADCYNNLGVALKDKGNFDDAIEAIKESIETKNINFSRSMIISLD